MKIMEFIIFKSIQYFLMLKSTQRETLFISINIIIDEDNYRKHTISEINLLI